MMQQTEYPIRLTRILVLTRNGTPAVMKDAANDRMFVPVFTGYEKAKKFNPSTGLTLCHYPSVGHFVKSQYTWMLSEENTGVLWVAVDHPGDQITADVLHIAIKDLLTVPVGVAIELERT